MTATPDERRDRTPKEIYGDLIQAFGQAWERADANAMAEVFADDGVFSPMPFDRPLRGRAAIRAYWRDIPKEQAEISFRWGEIFIVGPWFAVEFKCTFRRRRTGEPVDVRGALFCEAKDEKLSEARMYWHRELGRA